MDGLLNTGESQCRGRNQRRPRLPSLSLIAAAAIGLVRPPLPIRPATL